MEPRGPPCSTPHNIRALPLGLGPHSGPEMGRGPVHHVEFRRVGAHARAHLLLLGPGLAHVGGHDVLFDTRSVFDGRDCFEETIIIISRWRCLHVAVAEGVDRAVDRRVCDVYLLLFHVPSNN